MADHYAILGCSRTAGPDELKKAYHELVLRHHPDKSTPASTSSFRKIDEAWKILRDPITRKMYDEGLQQSELNSETLLFGSFSLRQLLFDSTAETYNYPCKCGGLYSFSKKDFEEFNSYLVGCDECSLMISVDLQS